MGTATAPTMVSDRSPTMDETTPTCHHQGGPNKQHSLCQTISNAMVRNLWIWHWGLQWQWPSMAIDNSFSVAWETHVEPPRIPSISSDHLHDHPTNGTGVTHLCIRRQFQRTWMDAKDILRPSECIITQCSSTLAWMDTCQLRDIPILTTHQGNRKHHQGLPLTGFA